MRWTRRVSMGINSGSLGTWKRTSTLSFFANWTFNSHASCNAPSKSTCSSDNSSTPESWREISKRSLSSPSKRPNSLFINDDARRITGSRLSALSSMMSAAIRTVVKGDLSS